MEEAASTRQTIWVTAEHFFFSSINWHTGEFFRFMKQSAASGMFWRVLTRCGHSFQKWNTIPKETCGMDYACSGMQCAVLVNFVYSNHWFSVCFIFKLTAFKRFCCLANYWYNFINVQIFINYVIVTVRYNQQPLKSWRTSGKCKSYFFRTPHFSLIFQISYFSTITEICPFVSHVAFGSSFLLLTAIIKIYVIKSGS